MVYVVSLVDKLCLYADLKSSVGKLTVYTFQAQLQGFYVPGATVFTYLAKDLLTHFHHLYCCLCPFEQERFLVLYPFSVIPEVLLSDVSLKKKNEQNEAVVGHANLIWYCKEELCGNFDSTVCDNSRKEGVVYS